MSKIMVVDDDVGVLKIMTDILEKRGHETLVADSGEMCIDVLKTEKPDLILMDVMMPEMDGWEVVRKVRRDKSNKDIIISMLTVKAEPEDKLKSMEVRADWHIAKPVTKDKLVETVEWLLTKQ
jgi:CheY-like chemotaxis protein